MKEGYREQQTNQKNYFQPLQSRRAIIESVNLSQWSADVRVIGGTQSIIKSVPMSSAITSLVTAGDLCVLDLFDETNPNDCIIAYTYGKSKYKKANTGPFNPSPTNLTIPHGLGVMPSIINVQNPGYVTNLYVVVSVDATYITLAAIGAPGSQSGYLWWAAIID